MKKLIPTAILILYAFFSTEAVMGYLGIHYPINHLIEADFSPQMLIAIPLKHLSDINI